MTGAMHVKLKIAAVGNDILGVAHFIGIEQADVQHALRQDFDGGFVGVYKSGAFVRGRNGRLLRSQNQIVQLTLRWAELAIGWEGARNVAGITV